MPSDQILTAVVWISSNVIPNKFHLHLSIELRRLAGMKQLAHLVRKLAKQELKYPSCLTGQVTSEPRIEYI